MVLLAPLRLHRLLFSHKSDSLENASHTSKITPVEFFAQITALGYVAFPTSTIELMPTFEGNLFYYVLSKMLRCLLSVWVIALLKQSSHIIGGSVRSLSCTQITWFTLPYSRLLSKTWKDQRVIFSFYFDCNVLALPLLCFFCYFVIYFSNLTFKQYFPNTVTMLLATFD